MKKVSSFVLVMVLMVGSAVNISAENLPTYINSDNVIQIETSDSSQNIECMEVITIDAENNEDIMSIAEFEHVYETDYLNDGDYYDYKIKICFNKDSNNKFTDCVGYISTRRTLLASIVPDCAVMCDVTDATHSISADGTMITIRFIMNFDIFSVNGNTSWSEEKTYVLHDYDV